MRDFYKGVVLLLAVLLRSQAYVFAGLVNTKTMGDERNDELHGTDRGYSICYMDVTPWFQNYGGTRLGNHHVANVVSGA